MDRPLARNSVFRAWVTSAALLLPACSDVSAPPADHATQACADNRAVDGDGDDQLPLLDPLLGPEDPDRPTSCQVALTSHLFAPPPVPQPDSGSELSDGETRTPAAEQPESASLRRLPTVCDQHVVTPAPVTADEPAYLIWRLPAIDESDEQPAAAEEDLALTIRRLPPLEVAFTAAPPVDGQPARAGEPARALARSDSDGPSLFGPSRHELAADPGVAVQQGSLADDPAHQDTAANTATIAEGPEGSDSVEVMPRVLAEPDDDDPLALQQDVDRSTEDGAPGAPMQDAAGPTDTVPVAGIDEPLAAEETVDVAATELPVESAWRSGGGSRSRRGKRPGRYFPGAVRQSDA